MDDLISRKKLLHGIDEKYPPSVLTPSESVMVSWFYEMVQAFPPAEPKKGKWIDADELQNYLDEENETLQRPITDEFDAGALAMIQAVKAHINNAHCYGWIPCSEALPRRGQKVLVCTDEVISIDSLEQLGWRVYRYEVIAWMPLPEPYKAED